jgi:hypothetical protein
MTLFFSDNSTFACGAVRYNYRSAVQGDQTARILIPVGIESILTYAVVDTGGSYIVCAPEIAYQLDLDANASLDKVVLEIRGNRVHGHLHRLMLTLMADEGEGESIEVDATAFVPDPGSEEWPANLPSFIGLSGCIERMRIAIDPHTEMFYFGPVP